MTRTLYWAPSRATTNVVGKLGVIEALEKGFGRMPRVLGSGDVSTLEVIRRLSHPEVQAEIDILLQAIDACGEIKIDVEY